MQLGLFEEMARLVQGGIDGPLPINAPIVLSYGLGVDSTAVLVLLHKLGICPDAILFADVGNEKPKTYAYLDIMGQWLTQVGFPAIDVVQYRVQRVKFNPYRTLAGNCLANRTLPSIAFFRHGCSLKWKGAELDKRTAALFGEQGAYRLIGYDASPADLRRFGRATKHGRGSKARPQDYFLYPLVQWGWRRTDCALAIRGAGLPVPPKSSCTFCSAMKPDEVRELEPRHLVEIVIIEANASPNLTSMKGLWHQQTMTGFIRNEGLLPADMVAAIWQRWSQAERVLPPDRETDADVFLQEEVDRWLGESEHAGIRHLEMAGR